jgi:uncharacterized membrane protein YfcA
MLEIAALAALALAAATVGTVTSFGTSTIMVPVLALFYPFEAVLLFTGIVHAANNVGKMSFFRSGIRWRLILQFGIPGLLVSFVGSQLVPDLPTEILLRVLAVFILAYVAYLWRNPEWQLPETRTTAVAGGAVTGATAAIFGVQGAVRALFLSAFDLPKEVFIFTAGAIGMAIDIARIGGYLRSGTELTDTLWIAVTIAVPAALLGSWIGRKIVDHVPQKHFRTLIAVALLAIAIRYLIWA